MRSLLVKPLKTYIVYVTRIQHGQILVRGIDERDARVSAANAIEDGLFSRSGAEEYKIEKVKLDLKKQAKMRTLEALTRKK